jgi:hypothetical protein
LEKEVSEIRDQMRSDEVELLVLDLVLGYGLNLSSKKNCFNRVRSEEFLLLAFFSFPFFVEYECVEVGWVLGLGRHRAGEVWGKRLSLE